MQTVSFTALPGLPEIRAVHDLTRAIIDAAAAAELTPCASDVFVIAQKIVSKAEGRTVDLRSVEPSATALELASKTGKHARLVVADGSRCVRRTPAT